MQGAMGQAMGGVGANGPRPTVRNPIMTMMLPIIIVIGGVIVATILGVLDQGGIGGAIYGLALIAAMVIGLMSVIKMSNELKAASGNPNFAWWPIFIPFYNYYWAWILVPAEMNKAKQMRGLQQPARGIVVYLFFFIYAFAADLNDIAKAP
jgi:hypothetical protein